MNEWKNEWINQWINLGMIDDWAKYWTEKLHFVSLKPEYQSGGRTHKHHPKQLVCD